MYESSKLEFVICKYFLRFLMCTVCVDCSSEGGAYQNLINIFGQSKFTFALMQG